MLSDSNNKLPVTSIIVAAAENNCIGKDGDLPWHIPGDLKRLKEITMRKPLIMGRKTHESVSAHRRGKPLPGRIHYVISRTMAPSDIDDVHVTRSLEKALHQAQEYAIEAGLDEIIIFGGAEIYRQALSITDKIYLTRVHTEVDGDAFFPELNQDEWQEISQEDHETDEGLVYKYITLIRSK